MVWYGMVWYGVLWCGMVWYGMVRCGMVQCGMVLQGVVWCGMVWCGMLWYRVRSSDPSPNREKDNVEQRFPSKETTLKAMNITYWTEHPVVLALLENCY